MNLFVLKGTVSNINIFESFKNSIRAFCTRKDGIALFNYLVVHFLKRKPFAASMKKKYLFLKPNRKAPHSTTLLEQDKISKNVHGSYGIPKIF
jgi:hypothetical protein